MNIQKVLLCCLISNSNSNQNGTNENKELKTEFESPEVEEFLKRNAKRRSFTRKFGLRPFKTK